MLETPSGRVLRFRCGFSRFKFQLFTVQVRAFPKTACFQGAERPVSARVFCTPPPVGKSGKGATAGEGLTARCGGSIICSTSTSSPIEGDEHNDLIDGWHRWTAHRKML